MQNRQHWQDWLTGIVGVWLIISPWVIGYGMPGGGTSASVTAISASPVALNFILSGVIALVLSGAALLAYRMWEEWIEAIVGLWLIASPWLLNFTGSRPAFWSAVLSGMVIVVAAVWNLFEEQQAGHA